MNVDIRKMRVVLDRAKPYKTAMQKPFQIDGWLIATCDIAELKDAPRFELTPKGVVA